VKGLERHRIKWVYLHAGPINDDGNHQRRPQRLFPAQLRRDTPEIEWIPWVGGDMRKLHLADPEWRKSLVATVLMLRDAGFRGVHLDLEPVLDGEPGYLELFGELRARPGAEVSSSATPPAAPGRLASAWASGSGRSRSTRAAMARTDQTVLMGLRHQHRRHQELHRLCQP